MARTFVKGAERRAGRNSGGSAGTITAGRRAEKKTTIVRRIGPNGRLKPGGRAVYYWHDSGDIVAVVPGGRDEKFESSLRASRHDDRIYVTFTDDAAHPDTHRVTYQRGDIAITPPRREVLDSVRAAKRARRAANQRPDRHLKGRLREARAEYRIMAANLSAVTVRAAQRSRRFRLLPVASKRLHSWWKARQHARWFVSRIVNEVAPSVESWQLLLSRGAPVIDRLFTPFDFLEGARWTKRQRRYARAIGFAGELAGYVNTREGAWYRQQILTGQRRHKPFLEPPGDDPHDRYPKYHRPYAKNPAWQRRYADWCIIRQAGLKLRRCARCGRHFFTEQYARARCPRHPPANLKALRLLYGRRGTPA